MLSQNQLPNPSQFANDWIEHISSECLSTEPSGTVRVSLAVPWKEWFRYLAKLRQSLHLARSGVAVLGTTCPGSLRPGPHSEPLRYSECGLFSPNLAEYAATDAICEPSPDQPRYSLEIRDGTGIQTHRIVIPPSQALATFQAFIRTYHTPRKMRHSWFPPNHTSSAARRRKIAGRIPWLRYRYENRDPNVTPITRGHLENVLNRCISEKQAIKTIIYNQSLILGALWTPEHCELAQESSGNPSHQMIRYFGRQTGLELLPSAPATVWLWTGTCSCCNESHWSLEVGGKSDELALAIHSGHNHHELSWQHFLTEAISSV